MTATAANRTPKLMDPEEIVRPTVQSLTRYEPATVPPPDDGPVVKLDMNESPFPPSPKTLEVLQSFTATNRYPDFEQTELRAALGGYLGRPADQIVCGAGLDDVLNTMAMTMIDDEDEVIISEPTFGVYRSLLSLHGANVVDADLTPDFQLDPDSVLDSITDRTRFIIICTPNNPTGNSLDRDAVEYVIRRAPCLVAVDEAYAEFAGVSYVDLLDQYDNLAVLRTMSKFAGLAGMRVGYGAFPKSLMPYLMTASPPFLNISVISRDAALASLDDLSHLWANVDAIVSERESLSANLAHIDGLEPFPSDTNFVLVRMTDHDGVTVQRQLAQHGVFVRVFPNPRLGIQDCIRVTVGSSDEIKLFLRHLREIVAPMGDAA